MTDLTSCYFCGTREAAEQRDAVPASLDPPAAVQQTVILCPSCREKLTAVLEPVFEHGLPEEDSGDGDATGDAAAADSEPADGADAAGDPSASVREETADEETGTAADRAAGADGASENGAGADGDPDGDAGDRETGGGEATGGGDDVPEDYHTVLRFLENREFPVAREEVETVVASAYDLGRDEVGEILDVAVRRDALVEAEGTLARSRDQL